MFLGNNSFIAFNNGGELDTSGTGCDGSGGDIYIIPSPNYL